MNLQGVDPCQRLVVDAAPGEPLVIVASARIDTRPPWPEMVGVVASLCMIAFGFSPALFACIMLAVHGSVSP
jgi:hypothetical protein